MKNMQLNENHVSSSISQREHKTSDDPTTAEAPYSNAGKNLILNQKPYKDDQLLL